MSTIYAVIKETLANRGHITSSYVLTADEVLQAGEQFLGIGYREMGKPGSGIFRSADGMRQFRMDTSALGGQHAPHVPHVHLEVYRPGSTKPETNNHIPFTD